MLKTPITYRLHLSQRRPISTSTYSSPSRQSSSNGHPYPAHNVRRPQRLPQEDSRSMHPRMIFVRPWDGLPTMAHAFAIIRDIERRFGKIQEFVILRDPDVSTTYVPYFHATFAKAEYADAIPLEGKVIQVPMPQVDKQRDGGVGLDDLEAYLDPETREKALLEKQSHASKEREWGPPEEGQVMDIKLERTGLRDPPAILNRPLRFGRVGPPHMNNPMRTQELAEAIHAFGGFVETPTQGNKTRMQAVLSRWSRMAMQTPKTEAVQEKESSSGNEDVVEPSKSEDIQWTPFTQVNVESASASIPSVPSSPPSSSSTSQQTIPPRANSKPLSAHTPEATSVTPPAEPKLSKKQRMVLAARAAGAAADMASGDQTAFDSSADTSSDSSAKETSTRSDGEVPSPEEEDNKAAARKWWNFLTKAKANTFTPL